MLLCDIYVCCVLFYLWHDIFMVECWLCYTDHFFILLVILSNNGQSLPSIVVHCGCYFYWQQLTWRDCPEEAAVHSDLSLSTTDNRFTIVNRVSRSAHTLVGNFTVSVVVDKLQTPSLEVRSTHSKLLTLGSGLKTNKSQLEENKAIFVLHRFTMQDVPC